jgi:uncharacterized membrane protein
MSESTGIPAKTEPIKVNPKTDSKRVTAFERHERSFSGPLPPPELLAEYEKSCPGAADRIISIAEKESEHRRSIEQTLVRSETEQAARDSHEARRGQICALVITLSAIVAGAYTALHGHEIARSIIGVGGIGGIVTSFLVGQARRNQNETEESTLQP